VIRRSDDSGKTWTVPQDKDSGLLLDGGRYHTAPVPVVVHHGRIWRAMEHLKAGTQWGNFYSMPICSRPGAGRAATD
ncbi:MAG: hypothetical protein ACYTEX_05645, partial [Planctomycetota bacterium]